MLLQQREREAIEPRKVLAQVPIANPRFILPIGDVEAPVTRILNAPMAADRVREPLHAHPETADVIANLDRLLPIGDALGHHHADRIDFRPTHNSRPGRPSGTGIWM